MASGGPPSSLLSPSNWDLRPLAAESASRRRSLTAAGAAHQLELKRKAYNHASSKVESKRNALVQIRHKYHNEGRKMEDYWLMRKAYDDYEKSSKDRFAAAEEYLGAEDVSRQPALQEKLKTEIEESRARRRVLYDAVFEDRRVFKAEQAAAAAAANALPATTSLAGAMAQAMASVTGADQSSNDQNILASSTSATNTNTSPSDPTISSEVTPRDVPPDGSMAPSRRSKGSGSNRSSSSLSSNARRRLEEEKARLQLEQAREQARRIRRRTRFSPARTSSFTTGSSYRSF